ncbi:hypothetical protein RUM44_011648 [Polyplax serrata]|uniref:Ig-like domain-containing protein n=1 Tax=Polyplax serrata TaxID=468196 RepID=A0ABR1AQL4_POLSC
MEFLLMRCPEERTPEEVIKKHIFGWKYLGTAYQPEFSEPIANLTVPVGRDATFKCVVQHLGGYRVSIFNMLFMGTQVRTSVPVVRPQLVNTSPTLWFGYSDRGQLIEVHDTRATYTEFVIQVCCTVSSSSIRIIHLVMFDEHTFFFSDREGEGPSSTSDTANSKLFSQVKKNLT